MLPDDVLLAIFDFHVARNERQDTKREIEAWQPLAHVCKQWRILGFGSSRRLNLQLYITVKTPVKDALDIWPALPLIINATTILSRVDLDNVIAALGQSNRVCEVGLDLTGRQLKEVLATMQVSFPELTSLQLFSYGGSPLVIPDSFLDGSAPRLQYFSFSGIPFPGLPKVLLSSTQLVDLTLSDTPHSGYISPKAMVALLSALSNLRMFTLEFRSPQSRPDRESTSLPPPKRSVLPALDNFRYKGVTEYLEEFVIRIDTPQISYMFITFFNQIDFDCPQLTQFVNCTPKLRTLDDARVRFGNLTASIRLRSLKPKITPKIGFGDLLIEISCREPDWQLSSIEQVCNPSLHPLSTIEDLYIEHEYSELAWDDDAIENTLWLELLIPFIAVKKLYLSKEFAPGIAAALQELVGISQVLPSLQNIFVEGLDSEPSGSFQEYIGRFVAARRLSDHLITISDWST